MAIDYQINHIKSNWFEFRKPPWKDKANPGVSDNGMDDPDHFENAPSKKKEHDRQYKQSYFQSYKNWKILNTYIALEKICQMCQVFILASGNGIGKSRLFLIEILIPMR